MATPGISAPAEQRVMIKDSWLDEKVDDKTAIIDCQNRTPKAAFVTTNIPRGGYGGINDFRGVSVNTQHKRGEADDEEATFGYINCRSKNDPVYLRERFQCGVTHPVRITHIKAYKTNARGIILKA